MSSPNKGAQRFPEPHITGKPSRIIQSLVFGLLGLLAVFSWNTQSSEALVISPSFILPNSPSGSVEMIKDNSDWGDERIVTAGLGIKTADLSSFIIRSYDSHSGKLISEDEFDLTIDEKTATSIEQGAGRIYAVGSGIDNHGSLVLLVRAYDAKKGVLLWEDSLSSNGSNLSHETALRTSILKNSSIQPSPTPSLSPALSSYQVQAVNPQTGKVVWTDEFMTNGEHIPKKMANIAESAHPFDEHAFFIQVQTFDFRTGQLLWKDQFNPLKALRDKKAKTSRQDQFIPSNRNATPTQKNPNVDLKT